MTATPQIASVVQIHTQRPFSLGIWEISVTLIFGAILLWKVDWSRLQL
jgi:hypothetical protein